MNLEQWILIAIAALALVIIIVAIASLAKRKKNKKNNNVRTNEFGDSIVNDGRGRTVAVPNSDDENAPIIVIHTVKEDSPLEVEFDPAVTPNPMGVVTKDMPEPEAPIVPAEAPVAPQKPAAEDDPDARLVVAEERPEPKKPHGVDIRMKQPLTLNKAYSDNEMYIDEVEEELLNITVIEPKSRVKAPKVKPIDLGITVEEIRQEPKVEETIPAAPKAEERPPHDPLDDLIIPDFDNSIPNDVISSVLADLENEKVPVLEVPVEDEEPAPVAPPAPVELTLEARNVLNDILAPLTAEAPEDEPVASIEPSVPANEPANVPENAPENVAEAPLAPNLVPTVEEQPDNEIPVYIRPYNTESLPGVLDDTAGVPVNLTLTMNGEVIDTSAYKKPVQSAPMPEEAHELPEKSSEFKEPETNGTEDVELQLFVNSDLQAEIKEYEDSKEKESDIDTEEEHIEAPEEDAADEDEAADAPAEEATDMMPTPEMLAEMPKRADEDDYLIDGKVVRARYRTSFMSRLVQADVQVQYYYSEVKNALLSYKGVKCKGSWNFESYNKGRIQCAKLNVKGKAILLYLGLDPEAYKDTKYRLKDMSEKPKFAKVPMLLKVRSDRTLKYALELIDVIMKTNEIPFAEKQTADYRMPYERNSELAKRGLVKLLLPKGVTVTPETEIIPINISEYLNS